MDRIRTVDELLEEVGEHIGIALDHVGIVAEVFNELLATRQANNKSMKVKPVSLPWARELEALG